MFNITNSPLGRISMSPSKIKDEQHKRYDELARKVLSGELAYQPAQKSKFSVSANPKFKHIR
ncbi:hypothetical protein GCM10011328_12400 [Hafnia psychrotolerans]|uniref:Uncharacterized protein n=1 Tax=Hafnia psychrotolerans TaxID=1477018 RepID=A0ABQ1G953_9GAMM|nr:hypothetical protein GCM10011328_12400 [Hafnia psychrotolerans]